uniref:Uncharacterized protein TCIL3000_9_2850 n=1 Tax=Trypanosoma congolense (strain IL3000) TaxID=1068625 RepID=G0UU24_TRYCI|nr:unnamed protein product [Trypanosoma congolense IL3000]
MGSDLSIALRTCEAPDYVKAGKQLPHFDRDPIPHEPKLYVELRLVDTNSPQTPESILQGDSLPASELFVPECAPSVLSELDTKCPTAFARLRNALSCPKCEGRVGFAVDSSVCIGRRLHLAEQRRTFTQCLSSVLAKVVLAMRDNASNTVNEEGDVTLSRDDAACKECPSLLERCEFFLLDLQHCMLDDASGPWIVRDFLDHTGSRQHQHSAVSLVHDEYRSRSPSIISLCLSSNRERLSTNYSSLQFLKSEEESLNTTSPQLDAAKQSFCRSLRNLRLSDNNMSLVGLRKCLLELVGTQGTKRAHSLKSLQVIDVRQNDETTPAQRFVAELLSESDVSILVGSSGLRWRYQCGVRRTSWTSGFPGLDTPAMSNVNRDVPNEKEPQAQPHPASPAVHSSYRALPLRALPQQSEHNQCTPHAQPPEQPQLRSYDYNVECAGASPEVAAFESPARRLDMHQSEPRNESESPLLKQADACADDSKLSEFQPCPRSRNTLSPTELESAKHSSELPAEGEVALHAGDIIGPAKTQSPRGITAADRTTSKAAGFIAAGRGRAVPGGGITHRVASQGAAGPTPTGRVPAGTKAVPQRATKPPATAAPVIKSNIAERGAAAARKIAPSVSTARKVKGTTVAAAAAGGSVSTKSFGKR